MESPYFRPVAANLIGNAIERHREDMINGVCGYSLEMFIYSVLNRAQYLTKSAQEVDKI